MLYVLIGAGNIGREIIKDILENDPASRFLAIDADPAALEQSARLDAGGRVTTRLAEAREPTALAPLLEGASVVINCTYGERILEILKAAIAAKVSYVDVNGTLFMEERLALGDAAAQAGITALLCMGVSPGLTNMLAAYGARKFECDVEIDCEYATYRPMNPTMGLLETALRQFRNGARAPVFERGEIHYHPPFSGQITTRFPGMDHDVDLVYTPHTEPFTVSRFVRNARRVVVRGTYERDTMALLRSLRQFGLLDPALKVTVDGRQVDFQPLLREALMGDGSPKPRDVPGLYVMRVRVAGGDRRFEIAVGHPPGWEKVPQGRMTALPTAHAAQMIAHGDLGRVGVCVPEQFTDDQVESCLGYLAARGMQVHRAKV